MNLRDFEFHLPPELISYKPARERDSSRLFVLSPNGYRHRIFKEIIEHLREGDILLLNNTKVIPARIFARKPSGGRLDILLIKELSDGIWEVITRQRYSGKIILNGSKTASLNEGRLIFDGTKEELYSLGHMPLPPYIKRNPDDEDRQRYQTIYAEVEGSIAAPTAGLHFTEALLEDIKTKGIRVRYLTLHIGRGTFAPIRSDNIDAHHMESECFEIENKLLDEIKEVKKQGGRLISVGTTTTRAIESVFSGWYQPLNSQNGSLRGSTDIFIRPGYEFKAIDALITNFHLPCSTPLILVSAFAGRDIILSAYKEAISKRYRFFSYGDAMLIEGFK